MDITALQEPENSNIELIFHKDPYMQYKPGKNYNLHNYSYWRISFYFKTKNFRNFQ